MQGWISLNRKIKNNWLWEDKPFSKGQAWIDLLLMVNHQKKKFLLGNQLVECDAGSTITSIRKLCDAWGWSNTKVKSFLEILVSDKMITYKSDTKKTVINVVNYKVYQGKEETKNDAETSEKRHESITNQSPKHTNNNVNKENNDNNDNKKDYLEVLDFYDSLDNLPGYNKLTDKRKGHINARLEDYDIIEVKEVLKKASQSKFLKKNLKSNWYSFDWIWNPNNFVKIHEDKYNSNEKPKEINGRGGMKVADVL